MVFSGVSPYFTGFLGFYGYGIAYPDFTVWVYFGDGLGLYAMAEMNTV